MKFMVSNGSRVFALTVVIGISAVHAQSCPFNGSDATLAKEGLILTRYALGLTGAPLVANTGIAAANAQTVVDSIHSPSWGLNITGNTDVSGAPILTTDDATIISRKIAGVGDAALTNGLALNGPRNTPAAVQNFLLAGCPGTAWIQGGNAFAAPGVLGTTDAQPLKVISGGSQVSLELATGGGLRVANTNTVGVVNVINGAAGNQSGAALRAVTIAGGGLTAPSSGVTSWGDYTNRVTGYDAAVGGGIGNSASNQATVPGGFANNASGDKSFAAGSQANAIHEGSFVWSDVAPPPFNGASGYTSNGDNTFNIRAKGGVHLSPVTSQFFGANVRQMLNLWGTQYGIGVQAGTMYFRTDANNPIANSYGFSWHIGGSHDNAENAPGGGGSELMRLSSNGNLWVKGGINANVILNTSDRHAKSLISRIDEKSILAKVTAMPITRWVYNADENKNWHMGPMAQDFRQAFGLGQDDKTIATVDADGVALAAIQGLYQIVKEKDARIAALEKKLAAIEKRLGL